MKRLILFPAILGILFAPLLVANAQGGGSSGGGGGGGSFSKSSTLPFGGLVSYTVPCTCPTSAGNLWIWFTPLYFGSPFPAAGPLVYVPASSKPYSWFSVGIPGMWHLGTYTPGSQGSQSCEMLVPPPGTGCFPLPSMGTIKFLGTTKPI